MDNNYGKAKSNYNLNDVIPVAVPMASAPDYNPAMSASRPGNPTPSRRDPSLSHLSSEPSFKIPRTSPSMPINSTLDDNQIDHLISQGYTAGLAKCLGDNNVTFPLRFWVVDNSGSMAATDGSQIIMSSNQKSMRMALCTRWKEIQETVDYHSQMAGLLKAPTMFRLLNNPGARAGPQEFGVADKGEGMIHNDLQVARTTMMNATPAGVTPLAIHIRDIRDQIMLLRSQLQSEGRRVAIVLATDGLPTNEYGICNVNEKNEFISTMRSLEGLPVWVVIRLCTNDEDVVEFYNDLDAQLELSVEVLDDYIGEAREVYEKNPWINYILPLHRMREMGFQNRLFDLLDERALTRGELRDFCVLLFGSDKFDGVPGSEADFDKFLEAVSNILKSEKKQWNPVKEQISPLIDVKKMNKIYGSGEGCSIM